MFRLIQDYTLKPLRPDLVVIHLWKIIEMYFVNIFFRYLSLWGGMVMFNWVYIASCIELLSESRKLSAKIVKTGVQWNLIRNTLHLLGNIG